MVNERVAKCERRICILPRAWKIEACEVAVRVQAALPIRSGERRGYEPARWLIRGCATRLGRLLLGAQLEAIIEGPHLPPHCVECEAPRRTGQHVGGALGGGGVHPGIRTMIANTASSRGGIVHPHRNVAALWRLADLAARANVKGARAQ